MAVVLLVVLLGCSLLDAQHINLKIEVVDSNSNSVSDATIVVYYSELINGELKEHSISGLSKDTGVFDVVINYSKNATATNYIFYQVYHPAWSSDKLGIKVQKNQTFISKRVLIPVEFDVYRVLVHSNDSEPISDVKVQLLSPFFMQKQTKSIGIVQFSIPKNSNAVFRIEKNSRCIIVNSSDFTNHLSATIVYPFENSTAVKSSKKYSFDLQILDSSSKPFANQKIFISVSDQKFSAYYFTDPYGFIRVYDVPGKNINLSGVYLNQDFSKDFDLSNLSSDQFILQKLLKINSPQITYLGESCYRVEVNITDPRADSLKKIQVKVIDGDESIAFTLDQNQIIDHSHILFNRVFCISKNTVFDLIASSPYEEEILTVQLIRDPATDVSSSDRFDTSDDYSDISNPYERQIPQEVRKKNEEQQRFEIILILFEILVFLVAIYTLIRFRIKSFYYLQSITRFIHLVLSPILGKKR